MTVFRAAGQGIQLSFKLWSVTLLLVLVSSAVGALATLLLPFEVVNGQTHVPLPAGPGQVVSLLVIGLSLYLPMMAFSLFLLGGVLGSAPRLLRNEALSTGEVLREAKRLALPILRWGVLVVGVALAAGMAAAFLFGFLWMMTGRSPGMKFLIGAGFWGAMLAAGLLLLYSPVILVERGQGVLDSFKESKRFFNAHRTGTFGLILWISFLGALIWLAWAIGVAPVIGKIREMMGIAPFAKGLPVFFFSLVLGLPAAYLSVFFPLALSIFYGGRNGHTGTSA